MRNAQGRFVRGEEEGEAEPEAEPEAESAGAGLAAGQAALLAAIAGRIEASEQRQAEARREQLAAFEARLARATAGAGGGSEASIGGEGVAQRPLDLVEDFATPPATQAAAEAGREAVAEGGGAGAAGGVAVGARGAVRRAVGWRQPAAGAEADAGLPAAISRKFRELEGLVEAHNLSLGQPSQLIVCGTPTEIAAQAEGLLDYAAEERGGAGPTIPYADHKYAWPERWFARQQRGQQRPVGEFPNEKEFAEVIKGYDTLTNAASKSELKYLYVVAARLNDVQSAVQSGRFGDVLSRREVRAAADAELVAILSLIEERLDPLLERCYARAVRTEGGHEFESEAEIFSEASFKEQMRQVPEHFDASRRKAIVADREKRRALVREAAAKAKAKEEAAAAAKARGKKKLDSSQPRG